MDRKYPGLITDLSRHPLLKQAWDVTNAIERCGGSVELTEAVVKSSQLLEDLNHFLAENGHIEPRLTI